MFLTYLRISMAINGDKIWNNGFRKKLMKIVYDDEKKKKPCYRISNSSRGHTVTFQRICDRSTYTQCPNNIVIFWFFNNVGNHWYQGWLKIKNVSCYINGDGTFDLKIHAVAVWGGGNLYNLDEIESEMIFYKTMKKIFFQLIQYLRKVRIT